jgi:hypothetical protein
VRVVRRGPSERRADGQPVARRRGASQSWGSGCRWAEPAWRERLPSHTPHIPLIVICELSLRRVARPAPRVSHHLIAIGPDATGPRRAAARPGAHPRLYTPVRRKKEASPPSEHGERVRELRAVYSCTVRPRLSTTIASPTSYDGVIRKLKTNCTLQVRATRLSDADGRALLGALAPGRRRSLFSSSHVALLLSLLQTLTPRSRPRGPRTRRPRRWSVPCDVRSPASSQ